jgi:hypothetical protein
MVRTRSSPSTRDTTLDPTVTLTQASGNTTVHIAWDATHQANVVLNGVLLNSFVKGRTSI